MAKKLTPEEIQARVADRGIILVSYGGGALKKSTWRCGKGHEWQAVTSEVTRGTDCPYCSDRIKLTAEEIQARVADRGITLLAYGEGVMKVSTWRGKCGHIWHANANNVIRGNNCPHCASAKLTAEEIQARVADRGITLLTYGGATAKKSIWRCNLGHEWQAKANSIMNGCGCPNCAKGGFDTAKPAHVYVKLLYRADTGHVTGYGITNVLKQREGTHARNLSRAGFTVLRSAVFDFAHGADAARAESVFDRLKGKRGIDCEGFKTESIHGDKFDLMCKALARIVLADER